MYKNLLDLHDVDPANQETVSKSDIYVATDDLSVNPSLTASKTKKTRPTPISRVQDKNN